ncbi:energy transducer TonB [Echinicola jeungdonensis]|uniref:Energy transducer TonB n=1 Tax=Echinicola jeungdonensis TaxID=709343 RepID=A0ABV5J5W7_9BACT|nr:energy transducer TonB [Echinicola jeungdonensis]MDN3670932.1 energy transducer TonB [Echinicola jeungdonensis]
MEIIEVFKSEPKNGAKSHDHNTSGIIPQTIFNNKTWKNFLSQNLHIPMDAIKWGQLGTVEVEFVVDERGNSLQPSILKSGGWGRDEEVLRLFTLVDFPKFNTNQDIGEELPTKIILPLNFDQFTQ